MLRSLREKIVLGRSDVSKGVTPDTLVQLIGQDRRLTLILQLLLILVPCMTALISRCP